MDKVVGSVVCECGQEILFYRATEVTKWSRTEIIEAVHPGNPNIARMRHDFAGTGKSLDTPELATFMAQQIFRAQLRNPCKSFWHKMHAALREMEDES